MIGPELITTVSRLDLYSICEMIHKIWICGFVDTHLYVGFSPTSYTYNLMLSILFSWDMREKNENMLLHRGLMTMTLVDSGSMGPSKQLLSLMQVAFV